MTKAREKFYQFVIGILVTIMLAVIAYDAGQKTTEIKVSQAIDTALKPRDTLQDVREDELRQSIQDMRTQIERLSEKIDVITEKPEYLSK